jgi:phosphoserine phosphatase RsbU/P
MRAAHIALIHASQNLPAGALPALGAALSRVGAPHVDWCDALFRHWPRGLVQPRIEPVAMEEVLAPGATLHGWDAAVLAPDAFPTETLFLKVADLLQNAMVPMLVLTRRDDHRLDELHPGALVAYPIDECPSAAAAMLFALASRQTAIRGVNQSLSLAQSFQEETASEIDRLHTELLLAARVQRDFLPKTMPEINGLKASVLFRPQGFVSGDTYDVYPLDERHVGFFLADAMGHGVPAALMTLYISGSLPRRESTGGGASRIVPPGEALTRLNAELHESLAGPARFATAVCGVVDLERDTITIACAGHPPPLRISRHGVRPVEVSGMLMGVVADFAYEQVTIRLEPDELLVLHSDGIENAFAPQHGRSHPPAPGAAQAPTLGMPPHFIHLAAMRRGKALTGVDAAMEALASDLDAQAGSFHQDDDVTVLAIERTARATSGAIDAERHLGRLEAEPLRAAI